MNRAEQMMEDMEWNTSVKRSNYHVHVTASIARMTADAFPGEFDLVSCYRLKKCYYLNFNIG